MFGTPITRPFRWALPLAVLGLVLSTILSVSTVKSGSLDCGSLWEYSTGPGRWQAYVGNAQLGAVSECPERIRRRRGGVAIVKLIAFAPAVVLTIRGFLWGANTLYRLAEERPTE